MSTSRVMTQPRSKTKFRLKFQNNTKEILTNFIKREEDFKQRDFKNMKKTLEINKELIKSLVKDCKESGMKNGLLFLNEENKFLNNQIEFLKKQRDDYHKRSMIAEQIIDDMKKKALDDHKDYIDTIHELILKLDRKEYAIQCLKYKYDEIEDLVRKYSKTDDKVSKFLKECNEEYSQPMKASTIVKKNKLLMVEIKELKEKISELEKINKENQTKMETKNITDKDNCENNRNSVAESQIDENNELNEKLFRSNLWDGELNNLFFVQAKGGSKYLDIKTCDTNNDIDSAYAFGEISIIATNGCDN